MMEGEDVERVKRKVFASSHLLVDCLFIDYGQPKLIYLPIVRIVSGQIWEGSRLYSIL